MNEVLNKEPFRARRGLSPMRQRNSGISPMRGGSMRLSPTRMSTGGALLHASSNNITTRRSISPKRNSASGALVSSAAALTTTTSSKRDLSPFGGGRLSLPAGGALPPADLSPLRSNGLKSTGSLPPAPSGVSPKRASSMRTSRKGGLSPIRASMRVSNRYKNMEFLGLEAGGLLEEEEPQDSSFPSKNPLLAAGESDAGMTSSSALTTKRSGSPETTSTATATTSAATSTAASSSKTGHATLELAVEVVQGEDLTTSARNGIMYGKQTSSNPYVIVSVLDQEGEELLVVGQTAHIKSTVDPIWNATLTNVIPPGTLNSDDYILQLKLMDHDTMFGVDENCTGIVKIPMNVDRKYKPCAWYDIPNDSAPNAKGRLQVAVQTKLEYAMDSFLGKRRNQSSTLTAAANPSTKKDDDDNNNSSNGRSMKTTSMFGMGGTSNLTSKSIMGGGGGGSSTSTSASSGTNFTFSTNFSTNFTGGTTTSTMMGMMFGSKNKDAKSQEGNPDEYEDIYQDEPVLNVQLTVHQGDKLVAKDRNAIGRFSTSDPYVIAEVWPKGIPRDGKHAKDYPKMEVGKTPTIRKNLSPVWNHTMSFNVPLDQLNMEEAQLRVRILDNDFGISDDDPMGSIDVYLQPSTSLDIAEKWYHVSPTSAPRACGRVMLSLTTIHAKQSKHVGRRRKQKDEPIKDTSTSNRLKEALRKSTVVKSKHDMPESKEGSDNSSNSFGVDEDPARDLMGGSMPARYSMQDDDDDGDNACAAVESVLLAANRNRGKIPKSRVSRLRKSSTIESQQGKERSQREQSSRRMKDGSSTRTYERPLRRQSTGEMLGSSSPKETETTRSSRTSRRTSKQQDEDARERRVRRARSHVPKLGTESSTSNRALRKASDGSAARSKDKEQDRRESSGGGKRESVGSAAGEEEGEKKRVSRSGRTGRLGRSSRTSPKEMKDNSTGSTSKSTSRTSMGSSSRRHHMSKSGSSSRRMMDSSSRRLHQSSSNHRDSSKRHLKKKSISAGNLATTVEGAAEGSEQQQQQVRGSPNGEFKSSSNKNSSSTKRPLRKKHSSDRALTRSGGTEKGEESPRKRTSQSNRRSSSERRISGSGRSSRPVPTKQRSSKTKENNSNETADQLNNVPELKAFDDSKNHGEHVAVAS